MEPKPDRSAQMRDMFKTRSHSWEEVGLSRQIGEQSARRARRQAAVLLPALAGARAALRLMNFDVHHRRTDPLHCSSNCARVGIEQ